MDAPLPTGQTPELSYRLSGTGRQPQPIALAPSTASRWTGSFILPADAGLNAVEALQFSFQAKDDLDNVGARILGDSQFQVYQGELPPLATPTGLQAKALPGGRVLLHWNAATGAADYQLFRQAPGQSELTAYQRTQGAMEVTDTVPTDGRYRYAVASVRKVGTEEALSPPGDSVEVVADATAPAAPTQLQLELTPAGVRATWQAPAGTDTLTYRLYRGATAPVSVAGLTPLLTGLKETAALNSAPSTTDHYYVVTAVDAAGNESSPSASAYLNVTLLPVANLQVVQMEDAYPVLSWSPAGGAFTAANRCQPGPGHPHRRPGAGLDRLDHAHRTGQTGHRRQAPGRYRGDTDRQCQRRHLRVPDRKSVV